MKFATVVLVALGLVAAATANSCEECWGKSSGPCRHNGDWSCFDYQSGTTCPAGSTACAPVDCVVSQWSDWGACSVDCKGGFQDRTRTIVTPASNGGAACPVLSETQTCNTHKCPEDICEVGAWSKWGPCDATCGGGSQTRTRPVISGFKHCPALEETQACNTHKCHNCAGCRSKTSGPCMHDAAGDFTCFEYHTGTTQCPAGTHACVTTGNTLGALGGAPGNGLCTNCFGKSAGPCMHDKAPVCHEYMMGTTTCPPGTTLCGPVNCEVSAWSAWGKCSVSCGGGSQSRSRSITVQPKNGGSACPALSEDQACNTQKCIPVCNQCVGKSSGPCQHDKDNTCFSYMKGTAATCPPGSHMCTPQDCVVSEWGSWSNCDANCDGGNQYRTRSVLIHPTQGGASCPSLQENQACNTHPCNNCAGCMGKSAGPCMHDKVPVCYDYYFGTEDCPAGTTECKTNTKSFGALNTIPGTGNCDNCWGKSAGPCRHNKDTSCYDFIPGTKTCPAGTTLCAPVDCEVSAWTAWDSCSVACGGGTQGRSRSVTVQPANGGAACPHLEESQSCNTDPCLPKCNDCVLGTHGPCQHDKDNSCFAYFTKGGLNMCPAGTHECIVQDCVVSDWSAWGKCSASCGGGSRGRARTVLIAPSPGGIQCPHLSETEDCNTQACINCINCAGKSAGPCRHDANFVCHGYYEGTETCPAGTTKCSVNGKTFGALGNAAGNAGNGMCSGCFGKSAGPCRHVKDTSCYDYMAGTTTCPPGTEPCAPRNCEVSAWTAWGSCSVTCGGGNQQRTRSVTVTPLNGGMACPHLEEDQACNTHKCPVACDHCPGKSAGECLHDKDGTCHNWITGTNTCPAGTTQCANIDCVVGQWSKWGACSATCGGGSQGRSRVVLVAPSKFGQQCPSLSEVQDCNTHACVGCAGCAGKSAGPCMQINNNVCYDYYTGTSTCPAGTVDCATTGNTLGVLGGAPGNGMCTGCDGKSSGPCRHDANPSCHDYMFGTSTCPPGTHPCAPINCEVSAWSAWDACSAECGGGNQGRTRSVTVPASNGGAACPHLEESQTCNTHKCPPGCNACWDKTSGPCRHDKDLTCHEYYTGTTTCPAGTTECVDRDCVVSAWSAWDACSVNCGGGLQGRSRTVLTPQAGNGAACPALSETQDCNTHACADCSGCWGGTSGPCKHDKDSTCMGYFAGTEVCPPGSTACTVTSNTLGLLGVAPGSGQCSNCFGKSAGPCRHVKDSSCYDYMWGTTTCPPGTAPCAPVDCEVSAWSNWGDCSASCGGGQRSRTRTVTVQPANGGAGCPALVDTDYHCNTHPCNVQCDNCAGGTSGQCQHQKDMTCFVYFSKGGLNSCPAGTDECVPVDCQVGAWGAWGKCSATCGGGSQTRTRAVTVSPKHGGAACPALSEDQACNTHNCQGCTGCMGKSAGPCMHDKAPVCYDYYAGTTDCPAGTTKCAKTFASLGAGAGAPGTGMCSGCFGASEGPCQHDKDTSCYAFGADGVTCPPGTHPCAPVDCVVSAWSAWDACSVNCGGGSQGRSRSVVTAPLNGGMECPHLTESQACNTDPCLPVCNACFGKSAGPCQHDKDNTCHGKKGGVCPPGTHECAVPVDCVVSDWSAWGACSAKCGGGNQDRTRTVLVAAENGGQACPALSESQACNTAPCQSCAGCAGKSSGPCKQDNNNVCYDYYAGTHLCPAGTTACVNTLSSFGDVGALDVSTAANGMCDGCFGKSSGPCRHVKDSSCFNYMAGTTTCPPGTAPCAPVNCEVSAWSAWSACSLECGGGSQSRSRVITVAPMNGGLACPHLDENQDCNTHKCPVRCDDCGGKSAGPCRHDKDGTCHEFNTGTTTCPAGTTVCEEVDCEVSAWSAWGKCSATCGGGLQQRSRSVTVQPTNGGVQCPHLTEAQSCNTNPCTGCAGCLGKSEGPCMHDKVAVCYGYYAGTTMCPAGTSECTNTLGALGGVAGNGMCSGCFGKSEGPCMNINDNACHGFMAGTKVCPPGTAACTPGNCVVSKWSAWSKCSATCGGGSQTRSRSVLQAPTNGGAACPSLTESQSCNTQKCGASSGQAGKCGSCAGGSSGPCRHAKDNVCHDYYFGTTICPAGTSACVLCDTCNDKTSGPCQHDADNSCHAFQIGTTCPAGTHHCGAVNKPAPSQCTGCWPGTAGPCQQKSTVCHDYFPGTKTCPGGTYECGKSGSFEAKPLAVFDVAVQNYDEDSFVGDIASAAGVTENAVVVESTSTGADGTTNVGFVVVSDQPAEAASAVSTALQTNQVAAGFVGMNKPLELSVGAEAASSASVGMSTTAIALIAVGAVAAIVIALAVVVIKKRSGGQSFMRHSSSKVMQINIPNSRSTHVSPKVARAAADLEDDSDDEE